MSKTVLPLVRNDPYLKPYEADLKRRVQNVLDTEARLTRQAGNLRAFASGHDYFGLHSDGEEWVLREWAPNATVLFLVGEATGWRESPEFALKRINEHGLWELRLAKDALSHGQLFRLRIHWPGGKGDRIPAWSRRVVQDPQTLIFQCPGLGAL